MAVFFFLEFTALILEKMYTRYFAEKKCRFFLSPKKMRKKNTDGGGCLLRIELPHLEHYREPLMYNPDKTHYAFHAKSHQQI